MNKQEIVQKICDFFEGLQSEDSDGTADEYVVEQFVYSMFSSLSPKDQHKVEKYLFTWSHSEEIPPFKDEVTVWVENNFTFK